MGWIDLLIMMIECAMRPRSTWLWGFGCVWPG